MNHPNATPLLSKEATLEESLQRMSFALATVDAATTLKEQRHPLLHCYSVNLVSKEAPNHIYSNGKGILSDASRASAYGEYIERLQTNNFFIDFYLPQRLYYPDAKLFAFDEPFIDEALLALYDPEGELTAEDFVDFNSEYEDRIVSLPFQKMSDLSHVYIPLNILSNLYVSNGLATGNTPHEAQVQALSEIYERYVKFEVIRHGYALPAFDDTQLSRFGNVYEDVMQLRSLGYFVEVLDASLGGRFPVTAISFINPKNNTLFVSFGAHPILEVALERTMTELMQGRNLEDLDAFERATFDMQSVADSFNLEAHFIDSNGKMGMAFLSSKKSFAFSLWEFEGEGVEAELGFLNTILQKLGKEAYIREYEDLDFYSCQIVVPTLSEVYPLDDMLYNNKNTPKRIRDMVLDFNAYEPEDVLAEIEALDETLNMEKYIGVIFEQNFTMREFKAQTLMALGEMDEAMELLEYGTDSFAYLVVELYRMRLLGLSWSEYEEGLKQLYGEECLKDAVDVLDGKRLLCQTKLHIEYTNILTLFDRLHQKRLKHTILEQKE